MWPRDNLESWKVAMSLIAEQPDDLYWSSYKRTAFDLFSSLEQRELNRVFRAGTSMHDIIFSTLDHHILKDEPRVTIAIQPKDERVKVFYSYSNVEFGPNAPVSEEACGNTDALPTILHYLTRLWVETKQNEPLPPGLPRS
jgi:hypothetical protein